MTSSQVTLNGVAANYSNAQVNSIDLGSGQDGLTIKARHVVMAAGYAWYRLQVARNAAAEKFFDAMGEETRLTGLQGGSPSEMPADRAAPTGRDAPRH